MDDSGDRPETGEVVPFPAPKPAKPQKPRPGGKKSKRYHEALARGDFEEAERWRPGRATEEIRKQVMAKGLPDPQIMVPYKPKTPSPRAYIRFTEEIANEVCRRVLNGEPLAHICDDPRMPDYTNIWKWEKESDDFRHKMAIARRDGSNHIADDCLKIADDMTIDPAHKRVMVETRLRLIKAWAPKIYGDQVKLTGDGEGGSIRFIVEGLNGPADPAANAKTIDATAKKSG